MANGITIDKSARVGIGLLAGLLMTTIGATSGAAMWAAQTTARLENIEQALAKNSRDFVTTADLRLYIERARRSYPDLPEPDLANNTNR